MTAHRSWIPALALAAFLALAPAGFPADASELRVGYSSDAVTLDPANHRSRVTEGIILNMYDALLARTDDMRVVPELAESWSQINPTTYEFKLRRGVRFHSGDEMTADDVKYTYDRLTKPNAMGGQTSPRQSLVGPLKDTEIVDKYTVRFVLREPWPIFTAYVPFNQIVSKSFTEKVGTPAMATQANGTGPFKLVEWRRGDAVILERFAVYYGGSPDLPPVGPARVDRVIFKIIPETASRVAALLAGEVDIIDELPHHAIKQLQANPRTKVLATNGTRSFFMPLNNTRPPFNDKRVRQAANHAVDRKLVIDRILSGLAVPLDGIISPQSYGFNANLKNYDYSTDKAKRLLAEAGHPNGIDVTLDVDNPFKDQAEALAQMLTRAGIRTKVQIWERTAMADLWKNPQTNGRDMTFQSWGDGALDPVGIFVPVLRTKDRGNYSGYGNPEVDKLLDAANTETDTAKRSAMYQQAQAIVNDEAPLIFLWLPQDVYGASARLKGWQPSPRGVIKLHEAAVD
ncbi:MAG: ABC transporter substrate-binding protein [Alphaproteobacteria bacterium]|nr:ABC transporter substrate-binding protein [Alphaproteobacteria bacterium]